MATPVVTPKLDQASYEPGDPITVSWTVVDADNSTETLRLEGTDSQGNAVVVNVTVNRLDPFTMNRVWWPRTGANLAINQATRTATGTVPTA